MSPLVVVVCRVVASGALMLTDSQESSSSEMLQRLRIQKSPLVAGTALSMRSWLPARDWSETRSKSRSHHATRMAALAFVDVLLDHDTSR